MTTSLEQQGLMLSFVTAGGLLAFTLSAWLLGYCSVALARRFATAGADAFWIALAAAVVQIGAISVVLSPARWVTPGAFIVVQAIVAAMIALAERRWPRAAALNLSNALRDELRSAASTSTRRLLLLTLGLLFSIAAAIACLLPIYWFDDRMYRASRAAYWLQHHSLMPWTSHNERQTAFPFGSELMFFWPLLMTRSDLLGRVVFFLGGPLSAIALWTVLREARATRTAALTGVLLLAVTPIFTYLMTGLPPELWMTLFVLGVAYYALRVVAPARRALRDWVLLGVFTALAINTKATALAIVPAVLVLPWLIRSRGSRARQMARVGLGLGAGALASGLAFVLVLNVARFGHPLGSSQLRQTHSADTSARQLRTHGARFIASLLDLPIAPPHDLRKRMTGAVERFMSLVDADEPLPLEEPSSAWPGPQGYEAKDRPSALSLGGLAWLPALIAVAAWWAKRAAAGRHLPASLVRMLVLAMLSVALLGGSVLFVRWMAIMERFWFPAYALGVPIIVLLARRSMLRWPGARYLIIPVLLLTVLASLWDRTQTLRALWQRPPPPQILDEPFGEVLRIIPRGSRILLVGAEAARDYPLFLPREGFVNEVYSWGANPFTPQRLQTLLDAHRITHVIVQDAQTAPLQWRPASRTGEMQRWLETNPAFREPRVPLSGMRLFGRIRSVPNPERPSPRYSGDRAGERGQRRGSRTFVGLREQLPPLPPLSSRPLPRVRGRGRASRAR